MSFRLRGSKMAVVSAADALPGRGEAMSVAATHRVKRTPLQGPFPAHLEQVEFAMGCFWGAERLFWQLDEVYSTAVGYAGGHTPNPLYEEVCSGRTGHAEVVRVIYDPRDNGFIALLKAFWEGHDPTQGMRQGNDIGTQYRSAIYYYSDEQRVLAEVSRERYQAQLQSASLRAEITTQIAPAGPFYFAEDYHQQYLHKNPGGYCGLGGTGVRCQTDSLSDIARPQGGQ